MTYRDAASGGVRAMAFSRGVVTCADHPSRRDRLSIAAARRASMILARACILFSILVRSLVPSPARIARAQRRRSLPARRDGFRDARTRCQSLYMVCSAASARVSAAYPATHSRSVASCECRRARRRVASTSDALHQGPDLLSSSTRDRTRSRSSSRRVCRARTSRRYWSRGEPGSGCSRGTVARVGG